MNSSFFLSVSPDGNYTHSEVFTDVATSVGSGQDGTVFVDATQLKTRTLEM